MVGEWCSVLQDPTLRPSLRDVDEELTQLMAEQSVMSETLAEKRKRDQELLEQMLPPQVSRPHCPSLSDHLQFSPASPLTCLLACLPSCLPSYLWFPIPAPSLLGLPVIPLPHPSYKIYPGPQAARSPPPPPPLPLSYTVLTSLQHVLSHKSFTHPT